ncbi:uncharacterized protein LOC105432342 [Pogonomyrmex barbatus]|uniref:Uncharacterized protein LOC105432342 n=1 Tax=Pogonomyrmex barbatus TaxID=144034 RepID=A0A6I9WQC3_9HYME|nr:uncharacterized protein LOC105432342 [Pogonomyrmex barbatus]
MIRGIGRRAGKDQEERLIRKEMKEIFRGMKDKKVVGIDGVPAEVWKYGGEQMEEWVGRYAIDGRRNISRGNEGERNEGRTAFIEKIELSSLTEKMENYRGISLLCTAYKIYAEVLRKRLKDEVEHGTLVPESQDLSSAFDNVNRKELWEILERKNINGTLIQRMKEIYEDTRAAIRTKDGLSEEFKTKKGQKNREAIVDMMGTLEGFLRERKLKLNTGECEIAKDWFEELGDCVEERISRLENDSLDERKEKVLKRVGPFEGDTPQIGEETKETPIKKKRLAAIGRHSNE